MRFTDLSAWLKWLESLHPQAHPSLECVRIVAKNMRLTKPAPYIITVAGTNGKGSCVALLEALLLAGGHRVGTYTSPHLLHYNERIKINGQPIADDTICEAFVYIDESRQNQDLTYFEFSTLAAFYIFQQQVLDVVILEVGLGGRLDAVNLLDADLAIISGIDFDHEHYLGNTREAIGSEKAGIMRSERPTVYGDGNIPQSILYKAEQLNVPLYCYERDYQYELLPQSWHWQGAKQKLFNIPLPKLPLPNAATVLQAHELLPAKLQVDSVTLKRCLATTSLPGRFQHFTLPNQATVILDVAHNPQACALLASRLQAEECQGSSYAIVAMLADKAISDSLKPLQAIIDHWYVAGLSVPRGADAGLMATRLSELGISDYHTCVDVLAAYQQVIAQVSPLDRIIVFGSFYTVSSVLKKMGMPGDYFW